MSSFKLNKEQMHEAVNALIKHMNTAEYVIAIKAKATEAPLPTDSDVVIDRIEQVQADYFSKTFGEEISGKESSFEASHLPLTGNDIVAQIRVAVKTFPDNETERLIMQVATIVENQLNMLIATLPEFASLRESLLGGGNHNHNHNHGHSHGGAPCNHNHGGHSPMPRGTPESNAMMKMAMQSLSPAQRETLNRVETTMKGGSPPSADDMKEMFMIQQQVMAFIRTMEKFTAPNGAPKKSPPTK